MPMQDGRRDETMPLYLTWFSYTPEMWARLAQNPEDRREAARGYIESVGGTLRGFWCIRRTRHVQLTPLIFGLIPAPRIDGHLTLRAC